MAANSTAFRKAQSFKVDYAPLTVTRYVSGRSGMHVVVVDRPGPKVHGYFALATEIFDNSGAPHTLEHLIFRGSNNFKYPGLLDKLSTKLFSTTNAWTASDSTVYTIETAGWESFVQILPVYVNHILLPNISESSVTTEVWHIDGEGKDGGVVYSEMQAIEYTPNFRMWQESSELLYAENSGYHYETGGLPGALRVLTSDRIRQFHRDMYTPRNLALIMLGDIDHGQLLAELEKFESGISDSIPGLDTTFKRPWVDSVQAEPLAESKVETVEFPEEDESIGEVYVNWFGPSALDPVESTAISVLLSFLSSSSASILENVLVEQEQIANAVDYDIQDRLRSVVTIVLSGVATEKLDEARKRLFELLEEVLSKPLDMTYLQDVLRREKRRVRFSSDGFRGVIADKIIQDFVYGARDGSTLEDLKTLGHFDALMEWTEPQWKELLRTQLVEAHSATVLGRPSLAFAQQLLASEGARVAARIEEMGEEGLKEAGEKVAQAKADNSIEIPDSYLEQWTRPGFDSIMKHLILPETGRAGRARDLGLPSGPTQQFIDAAPEGSSPLFIQFEQVPWDFIQVEVHMTTSRVPTQLLPLLALLKENFFKTHIMRNGTRVDFEDVIKDVERDTVGYTLVDASGLSDSNGLELFFQLEVDKYAAAVGWIRTLIVDSVFDVDRLKVAVSKMLAYIPEAKRDGRDMADEISDGLHVGRESLSVSSRVLVSAIYLQRLKALLDTEPAKVLGWLEELQGALFSVDNMRVLVTGNVKALENPVAAWDALASAIPATGPATPDAGLAPIVQPHMQLTEEGRSPGGVGAVIVPITAIDSSFLISTGSFISSYTHPDFPAYLVTAGFLGAAEGPFWNAVRGLGLAYGVSLIRDIETGLIKLLVYRSPDSAKALVAVRDVVSKLASGETPIDDVSIEGAVSQVVTSTVDGYESPSVTGQQEFIWTVIRGLPGDIGMQHLELMQNVTADDIRRIIREYILPLTEPSKSNVVVTCATVMQEGLEQAFNQLNYKTQVKQLSEFYDDYGLEGPEVDPDAEDEELEEGSEGSESEED